MDYFIIKVSPQVHSLLKNKADKDRRTIKDTVELIVLESLDSPLT